VDVIFDLLGDLLGELIGRPISNRRGRSLARQIAKLTQARRTGQPVSATLPAALHAGEAVPPRPHAWQPGRLKITPSAVSWQRRGLLRSRSRDLTSAQYIRQRQPDWSGIDRRLSAPGYLAPSVQVLALHANGEQIEITLPSEAIDVVLPPSAATRAQLRAMAIRRARFETNGARARSNGRPTA